MAWRHALDKFKMGPLFGVVDSWHPNGHRGTDYNGFKGGTKLFAVNDGKIVVNKWSDGLGNVVVLEVTGPIGKDRTPTKIYFGYCHMDKPSPLAVGTTVASGDVVGTAGTTGKFSSGVHLHLTMSLLKDGVFAGKVYDAHGYIERRMKEQNA